MYFNKILFFEYFSDSFCNSKLKQFTLKISLIFPMFASTISKYVCISVRARQHLALTFFYER